MGNSPKGPSFGNKNFNVNNYGPTQGTSFSRIPNEDEIDMNMVEKQRKLMMNNNNIQNFSNMGLGNMVPTFDNNNNISNNDEEPPVEGMGEKY